MGCVLIGWVVGVGWEVGGVLFWGCGGVCCEAWFGEVCVLWVVVLMVFWGGVVFGCSGGGVVGLWLRACSWILKWWFYDGVVGVFDLRWFLDGGFLTYFWGVLCGGVVGGGGLRKG